jgi:hypothetical protein
MKMELELELKRFPSFPGYNEALLIPPPGLHPEEGLFTSANQDRL